MEHEGKITTKSFTIKFGKSSSGFAKPFQFSGRCVLQQKRFAVTQCIVDPGGDGTSLMASIGAASVHSKPCRIPRKYGSSGLELHRSHHIQKPFVPELLAMVADTVRMPLLEVISVLDSPSPLSFPSGRCKPSRPSNVLAKVFIRLLL
jgi:hypothetical protein